MRVHSSRLILYEKPSPLQAHLVVAALPVPSRLGIKRLARPVPPRQRPATRPPGHLLLPGRNRAAPENIESAGQMHFLLRIVQPLLANAPRDVLRIDRLEIGMDRKCMG